MKALLGIVLMHSAPIHVRVDGDGYFRFARGVQAVYMNEATLSCQNGLVCNADGFPLLPQTRAVAGANLTISMDGSISVSGKAVGHIVLASFPSGALQRMGRYLVANSRSRIGFPGEGTFGVIRTGAARDISSPGTKVAGGDAAGTNVSVEISLRSEIDDPDIHIGKIAEIQAPGGLKEQIAAVDLGATPMFGAQRGITRSYVTAAMRHAGIDVDKLTILCPAGAFVLRKGQKVDAEMLLSAARQGIAKSLGVAEEVRCDRLVTEFQVPAGQLSFTTVQAIPVGDGYTVNLEVDVDGKMVTRRTLTLVPVNPAVKVAAGEAVKIRVIKNGASVEVDGKTRTSGKVGSTVSVQSDAGATFTGILVTAGLVEVNL